MRRRALLASLAGGTAAPLAGCLDGGGGGAGPVPTRSEEPTDGDSTDRSTTAGPARSSTAASGPVSVGVDALQPALVTRTTADSIGVTGGEWQYLYLTVDAGDPAPAVEAFAFEFGGEEYVPLRSDPASRPIWRVERAGATAYAADRGAGLLLFRLPESAEEPDPALTWPGGEWRPGGGIRRRLAAPEPPLSATFGVPETVRPGEDPTLSFAVTNEGDLPGRFVAAVNRGGPYIASAPVERIGFLVPAGETVTREFTDGSIADRGDVDGVDDGEPDMTYSLDWTGGGVSRSVRYV